MNERVEMFKLSAHYCITLLSLAYAIQAKVFVIARVYHY